MIESGYYPPGAEYDPNAPYNQVDPEPMEFEVSVEYTLYKEAVVESLNYEGGGVDEEGYYERPDYTGNSEEDYEEMFLSPLQIFKEYKEIMMERLVDAILEYRKNKTRKGLSLIRTLRNKIASAEGWEV